LFHNITPFHFGKYFHLLVCHKSKNEKIKSITTRVILFTYRKEFFLKIPQFDYNIKDYFRNSYKDFKNLKK
jgi:hypothetical protein